MKVEFSLTREDLIAVNSYRLDKSKEEKRAQYIYYPLIMLVSAYAVFFFASNNFFSARNIPVLLIIALFCLAPMFVYKPIRRWEYSRGLDKRIKRGACNHVFGKWETILQENKLIVVNGYGYMEYKWENINIKCVEQNDNYIFISSLIIPKRYLFNDKDAQTFYELAREYANKSP